MTRIKPTIRPYNPRTSAKIKIRIMPTNKRGCWAVPLTPASPTIPMAKPEARPLNPTLKPAPKSRKLLQKINGTKQSKHWHTCFEYIMYSSEHGPNRKFPRTKKEVCTSSYPWVPKGSYLTQDIYGCSCCKVYQKKRRALLARVTALGFICSLLVNYA